MNHDDENHSEDAKQRKNVALCGFPNTSLYQKFYEAGDANEILGSGRFDAQNKKAAYTVCNLAASHCEIEERFLDCVPPRAHRAKKKGRDFARNDNDTQRRPPKNQGGRYECNAYISSLTAAC